MGYIAVITTVLPMFSQMFIDYWINKMASCLHVPSFIDGHLLRFQSHKLSK